MSTDARQFGNWPISGAKPYNPSMKPAAVFPRYPVSPPISPVSDPTSYVKCKLFLSLKLNSSQPLFPCLHLNGHLPCPSTFCPPSLLFSCRSRKVIPLLNPPIEWSIDPVVPIRNPQVSHNPVKPVATSYQLPPPQPAPLDGYARPPAYPTPQRSPAIVPSTVNKQQGIGMGLQAGEDFTKVRSMDSRDDKDSGPCSDVEYRIDGHLRASK